ncbi:MAG: thiamine pyrophosphate-binding protein [Candidatus Nanoarchaeia archaeon]|nr:thiamine pyrophosphate-binding protein [Candidatus Nanoarchaeia archaeon]MDD5239271.1 thiamine pyrophosphate-binding protein [Candidatus Nanoarchaeia archaeon]
MKASDYIVKYLEKIGVKCIFGYTGGAITHIFDSIYKNKTNFVTCYHEQAASFEASAAAKLTGELQVAVATSGPGATNLITGIADSFFDSTPVLFITGQVNTYDFKYNLKTRQRGFQETDIVSIVKPITKYCALVDKPELLVSELKKAVKIATSGRKGPVLLDIPMDIQRAEIKNPDFGYETPKVVSNVSQGKITEVISKLKNSKLPLILAGGGCSAAQVKNKLIAFAERLDVPVAVSLMGKDSFPNNHPLFAGFIGSYGNRYGNLLLAACDTLLVLGSRLDSRQTGNMLEPFSNKNIIWVDLDEDEMESSRVKNTVKIQSDVSIFLEKMNNSLSDGKISVKREKLVGLLGFLKKKYGPLTELKRENKKDWHYQMLKKVSDKLDRDDVVCVDVGQNQMLAAQVIEIRNNQRFINSGGMAPMGFALPAAIGINRVAGKRCVVICGDGGFQMNVQELNTVSRCNIPVIIIVLNNNSLGMIKQFQDLYFESRYAATDPDSGYFASDSRKIAEAYGIKSYSLNEKSRDIDETLNKVFSEHGKPVLLEINIDYTTYLAPKLRFDRPINRLSPDLDAKEEKEISGMLEKIS